MNDERVLIYNFSKCMGEEPHQLLGALIVIAFEKVA
jgi:hypothetical protein